MFDFGKVLSTLQGTVKAQVIGAAVGGVGDFTKAVESNAQERAPIEKGDLAASATSSVTVEGEKITGEVGFNAAHAAARHERPPEKDAPPKINPKGENKFLEKAMRELAPKFDGVVGGRVKDVIG